MTKYYSLSYALVAVMTAFWLILLKLGRRAALRAAAYGLAGMAVFGGY